MEHERITANPAVMVGKPVIRGTRITVELILRLLGAGHTIDSLLDEYPHLTREDILAAQSFAADYLSHEIILAAE
jgi:uncharacterized protein (DUF433 family)